MINFNVSFSVLISFVKFVASMAEHDSDGDVVCDTSGYCACPSDRRSHAMVPIILNKTCCMFGKQSGSGDVIGSLYRTTL